MIAGIRHDRLQCAAVLWLACVCLALVGCKPATVTKGTGEVPGPLAVPGPNGPVTRTALVIGNTRYKHLQRLDACKHDAQVMADTFRKIGIALHQGKPFFDLNSDEMDAAINSFARSLDRNSEAYIYYSGHGAQIGGGNYLLPVNFDAQYESQAKRQAISLDNILEALEKTDSRLRVVILDACRDPGDFLPGEALQKGATHAKGLNEQPVDAPETLVCFATKHGTAALADDTSSYYSRALAEEMVKPGKITDVLQTVARRVYAETEKRQLPFTYGSLLQDHYFVTPLETRVATPASQPVVVQSSVPTPTPEPAQMAKLTTPSPRVEPGPANPPPAPGNGSPATATKDAAYVNSLGMKFVPVPGTQVLFSAWDTRVQDYAVYAREKGITPEKPFFEQGADHPVVQVSWEDAQAFCAWLSKKEGRAYRLPTDEEWSAAVGLGVEAGNAPAEKSGRSPGYPWGGQWPPPHGAGNYASSLGVDSFANTSPVGSFAANRYGLYDMGGNVWQWCEDWFDAKQEYRVVRGASWVNFDEFNLRSSCRNVGLPANRDVNRGFRCVLVVSGN